MGAVSFVRFLFAMLLSFLAAFFMLGVLAFVAMRLQNPQSMIAPCAVIATLIGAWCCGFFGAGVAESHKKLWGMLCYAGYLLIILLCSFFLSGTPITWLPRLILVIAGSALAYFGSCFRRDDTNRRSSQAFVRRAKKKMYRKA
jgi:putative membrane protein (TIGR04086 family)